MARKSIDRSTPSAGNVIDLKTGKPVERPTLPIICERIRHYREKLGMEQKVLAKKIGVTGNSVSNWEKGRSRPDINLIPGLCEALQVSLYELYGVPEPEGLCSGREQDLLEAYRRLTAGHKYVVDALIEKLIDAQLAESCPPIRTLPLFDRSLAAGIGDPTEFEEHFTPLYVYEERVSSRADCAFAVSGDSMEPAYHSGDMVLVERIPDAPRLDPREIGAFIVGNETYIKQYREDGLYSLNPHYAPMHFSGETGVYLIGRVLGVLDPSAVAAPDDAERFLAVRGEEQGR